MSTSSHHEQACERVVALVALLKGRLGASEEQAAPPLRMQIEELLDLLGTLPHVVPEGVCRWARWTRKRGLHAFTPQRCTCG